MDVRFDVLGQMLPHAPMQPTRIKQAPHTHMSAIQTLSSEGVDAPQYVALTALQSQWPALASVRWARPAAGASLHAGGSFKEAIRTEALARGSRSQLVALDPTRGATAEAEKHAHRCPSPDASRRRRQFCNLDAQRGGRRVTRCGHAGRATLIYAAPLIERNCDRRCTQYLSRTPTRFLPGNTPAAMATLQAAIARKGSGRDTVSNGVAQQLGAVMRVGSGTANLVGDDRCAFVIKWYQRPTKIGD
ncbi:hypothetical protein HYPSUDRAFT_212360 [Hypholoma sublateritium FD-334 SS-4]|uniref:Uncharacterized protein n=1 Tax=Hypholoma sublateritium (strain FD-334 SS-4) TaxID=945553 RepID=A0A0D2MUX2_HYPSF|nr:hypothetical protein HYPSUDRAFT_212360 [Hypholoma sublateritium FD-334 SS-4]